MIVLHKLNDEEFVLNSNHIEIMEEKPHTIVTLTNEKKYIVKETIEEIIKKVMDYQKNILAKEKGLL